MHRMTLFTPGRVGKKRLDLVWNFPGYIAPLDQRTSCGGKIPIMVKQGVSAELGVSTLTLETCRGREDIEQIRPGIIGRCADAQADLPRTPPVAFTINDPHKFPTVRKKYLLPGGKAVEQIPRPLPILHAQRLPRQSNRGVGSRHLIERASDGKEPFALVSGNGSDGRHAPAQEDVPFAAWMDASMRRRNDNQPALTSSFNERLYRLAVRSGGKLLIAFNFGIASIQQVPPS